MAVRAGRSERFRQNHEFSAPRRFLTRDSEGRAYASASQRPSVRWERDRETSAANLYAATAEADTGRTEQSP